MSILLTIAAAAATAGPAPTLAACSWDRPGANPFMGDVVAAVDRYQDIPAATRQALKKRMAARKYDEIATIRRDVIEGSHSYTNLREMHFGKGQVCSTVTRDKWTPQTQERGLVYCEDGHCIIVPTVCRNVSRVSRITLASRAQPSAGVLTPGTEPQAPGSNDPQASAPAGSGPEPQVASGSAAAPSGGGSDEPFVSAADPLDNGGGSFEGSLKTPALPGLGDWGLPWHRLVPRAPWTASVLVSTGIATSGSQSNGSGGAEPGGPQAPAGDPDALGRAIAGTGTVATGGTALPTPEPGTWGMMLVGLVLVGAASRRRRTAA